MNYLTTINLRYHDAPKPGNDNDQYIDKTITLGVFDTREEANEAGNKALEVFERYFKLNPNYNKRERFSSTGGLWGSPKDLISDLGYIKTPFAFYAKVTPLVYADVEQTILDAVAACNRHNEWATRAD